MQWPKNMQLIDANVILRYLLNDNSEMSPKAKAIVASGSAYTKPEIVAEVDYVLKGGYRIDKEGIRKFNIQSFFAKWQDSRVRMPVQVYIPA